MREVFYNMLLTEDMIGDTLLIQQLRENKVVWETDWDSINIYANREECSMQMQSIKGEISKAGEYFSCNTITLLGVINKFKKIKSPNLAAYHEVTKVLNHVRIIEKHLFLYADGCGSGGVTYGQAIS